MSRLGAKRSLFAVVAACVLVLGCAAAADPTATAAPAPSDASTGASSTPVVLPPFAATVRKVTAKDLPKSWHRGCPVGPKKLRLITMRFYGFDKKPHTGKLVVHKNVVDAVVRAFEKAYESRFPIRRMRLVDHYGGDDRRSMKSDNTSAFNCRKVAGSSSWSRHAYGKAIDVNPRENPYVWRSHGTTQVSPKAGRAYLDRSDHRKGMLRSRSVLVRSLKKDGWGWGGRWRTIKDYQHLDLR